MLPWMWTGGATSRINPPDQFCYGAGAVSNTGRIVGSRVEPTDDGVTTFAFSYDGSFTDLHPPGFEASGATAISADGSVVLGVAWRGRGTFPTSSGGQIRESRCSSPASERSFPKTDQWSQESTDPRSLSRSFDGPRKPDFRRLRRAMEGRLRSAATATPLVFAGLGRSGHTTVGMAGSGRHRREMSRCGSS